MIGNQMETICSVVILNYNGKSLLGEFLPNVINEAEGSRYSCEVVVVDNQSTDDSIEFIRKNYPVVKIEVMGENLFLVSFNSALKQIKSPYVILMNNDIKLKQGFIDNIMENLQTPGTFAVSPKICGIPGNELQYSALFPIIRKWWFYLEVPSEDINIPVPTILAHGGVSGYNREIFISLGGFDRLFLPGYNEDLDLSYRAVKMGYKIIYVPSAVAFHRKGATMDRYYANRKVIRISLRNHFLFIWKNITDNRFSAMHFLTLPFRLVVNLIRGNTDMMVSFFWTFKYIHEVYRKRKETKKNAKYTDREILLSFQVPSNNNL